MSNYPIYIIYSGWTIENIICFFKKWKDETHFGFFKILYDYNGNQTNKTIVVISDSLYADLMRHGYGQKNYGSDFYIKNYYIDNLLPPANKSSNLFIPTTIKNTKNSVIEILNINLNNMAMFNIIKRNSWELKFPIDSYNDTYLKMGCFILFKNESAINIGVVRFLLNNASWYDTNGKLPLYNNIIKCEWAYN